MIVGGCAKSGSAASSSANRQAPSRKRQQRVADQIDLVFHQHVVDVGKNRRELVDLVDDTIDLRGQHLVDGVEVRVDRRQLRAGRDLLDGDAEVEIDVRVHSGEHVLDDDRLRMRGTVERHAPARRRLRERAGMKVAVQRGEVAAGEGDVEELHARPVLKQVLRDGGADGDGDPLVERREVSEPAFIRDRPGDDALNRIDHFVDRCDGRNDRRSSRHGRKYRCRKAFTTEAQRTRRPLCSLW